jgi:hypothetical protein
VADDSQALIRELATLAAEMKHVRHGINNVQQMMVTKPELAALTDRIKRFEDDDFLVSDDLQPLDHRLTVVESNINKAFWLIVAAWVAGLPVAVATILKGFK